MSLMKDTRRVALAIRERVSHLNVLIHSADVLMTDRVETAEGHELSFATNYLSRFLMNDLLLDTLKAGRARILHIAAPGFITLKASQFPPAPDASGWTGHGVGQGANDVYGLEMAERLAGSNVTINILNPGGVNTGIRDQMTLHGWQKVAFPVFMPLIMKFVFRMEMSEPADYARIPVEYATDSKHAGLSGHWIKWDGTFFRQKPGQYPPQVRTHILRESERMVAAYRDVPEAAPV
jgi:NAD(P)-dependent dehydrogenase (short-subunit alcohol dehydrogenase family)